MARDRIFVDSTEIVDTAFNMINKEGVTAFSTRKLAQQLVISPMARYNYVRNKNEIIERGGGYPQWPDPSRRFGQDLVDTRQFCKSTKQFCRTGAYTKSQYAGCRNGCISGRFPYGTSEESPFRLQNCSR